MTGSGQQCVHASCVACGGKAVLIRGKPGSGKSSLALQLIDAQEPDSRWQLVSDDQTTLEPQTGLVLASAPAALRGLMELRGLGILRLTPAENATVVLVVDLEAAAAITRMPEPRDLLTEICGIEIPRIFIDASHPSALARTRTAFHLALEGQWPPGF